MKNFKYFPELTVQLSDIFTVKLEGKKKSTGYTNSATEEFFIDKNQPGEKYLFLPNYNKETGSVIVGRGTFYGFGRYTIFNVIPNSEVSNLLLKRKKTSGLIPVIVPPAYTTPEEVVNYLIKGKFSYHYEYQVSTSNYNVERLLNYSVGGASYYFNDNDSTLNNYNPTLNQIEAQKRILHTIVLNEFVSYAKKRNNMKMNFNDYISNNKNVERIKKKFSTFSLSYNEHTRAIVKYAARNSGRVNSPLQFEVLNTMAKRESMRYMTAQNVVDFALGVTDNYDYNSTTERNYYGLYRSIDIPPSTYKVDKIIVDILNHLNNSSKKTKYNYFNTKREQVEKMLTSRSNRFFKEYKTSLTKKESNEITRKVNRLTKLYTSYTRNYPMLSVVFDSLGEDYLKSHIRPTNLFALSRLFIKPSETLGNSSYLKTIAIMIVESVKDLDNDEYGIKAKNYICDIIFDIVSMKNKCVVYRNMGTMSLPEVTNGYSYEDFPPYMISNILFTEYNNLDGIGKFKYDNDIKALREIEDKILEEQEEVKKKIKELEPSN